MTQVFVCSGREDRGKVKVQLEIPKWAFEKIKAAYKGSSFTPKHAMEGMIATGAHKLICMDESQGVEQGESE